MYLRIYSTTEIRICQVAVVEKEKLIGTSLRVRLLMIGKDKLEPDETLRISVTAAAKMPGTSYRPRDGTEGATSNYKVWSAAVSSFQSCADENVTGGKRTV